MEKNSNHVQTNVVYTTKNLEIFKSISGNRVPNLQHVKRLTSSIKQYGMKCNPILVNEKMEVIDGQHRLMAAKEAGSEINYIIINGYSLNEVHTLNLNQKNWTKKDFMDGYAEMGIESYSKLKAFAIKNDDFNFNDCISLCSNVSSSGGFTLAQQNRPSIKGQSKQLEVFESGSWKGKDFLLAQDWANKIRSIKPYYLGYNRSNFVGTLIILLQNKNFDFNEFVQKIRLQPTALVDCANRDQYKTLIENIYNYHRREKINLRF